MARLSRHLRCLVRNTVGRSFPGDKTRLISKIKLRVCKNNCRQLLAVRTDFLRGLSTNTRHAYTSTSLLSKPVSPERGCKDTKNLRGMVRRFRRPRIISVLMLLFISRHTKYPFDEQGNIIFRVEDMVKFGNDRELLLHHHGF